MGSPLSVLVLLLLSLVGLMVVGSVEASRQERERRRFQEKERRRRELQ